MILIYNFDKIILLILIINIELFQICIGGEVPSSYYNPGLSLKDGFESISIANGGNASIPYVVTKPGSILK